jgi:predicted nuclease with TOPRIM domain
LLPFVPFAKGASPERLEDALDALKSAPISVQDELKSVLVVLGTQVFESWDWRRIIKKEGLMGLRLIDELLADQKEELLRQGEHNARLRMLTEQLQARLRGESSAFIEALPKLKPNVHDKVANLIATVRSKKNLIQ